MKKYILSLLCAAPFTLFAAPSSVDDGMRVSVEGRDIDLILEGRMREEFFYFDKVTSLRSDYNDTYHFFRNKMRFGSYVEYGNRRFGAPAISGELRMCAFNYWDHPTQYNKLSEETVKINHGAVRSEINLADEHTHFGAIPSLYQDRAWINIDFDTLFPDTLLPLSMKVGYFPYQVGRGVSLGSYHEGSISFMGWQERSLESNATQSPQGILFTAELSATTQVELYYSKWRSYTTTPTLTREGSRAARLDVSYHDADPKSIERGLKADRNLIAGRVLFDGVTSSGIDWHVQPYGVYVDAPEQKIELAGDASTQLGTYGVMAEFKNDQFAFNVEAAFQYGSQTMHGIDRNKLQVEQDENTGELVVVHSHILQGDTLTDKMIASDRLSEVAWLDHNRGVHAAGSVLAASNGTEIKFNRKKYPTYDAQDPDDTPTDYEIQQISAKNANYPFLGKARFRKEYKIDLRGFAVMADAQFRSANGRVCLNIAGAWISGDEYPYNGEVDKRYNGFLPLRDQNYDGKYVKSIAILHARKFPRPVDMADHKMYAFNHDEDMSNLRYVGMSLQCHPLANPAALIIVPSIIGYWQDCPPYTWNKNAARSFDSGTDTGVYKACQTKLGFSGAATSERASNHLGTEVALSTIWNMAPGCSANVGIAAFIPGRMYTDIDGMPNRYTRRVKADGNAVYESLGNEVMLGLNARLTFAF